MDSEETADELRQKLEGYREQMQIIVEGLKQDPENEELQTLQLDVTEVINLTRELLKMKEMEEQNGQHHRNNEEKKGEQSNTIAAALPKPIVLPPHIMSPSSPTFFAVGTVCEARFTEDGVWYKALIEACLEGGKYQVTYVEYGNQEVVSITDIRPVSDANKKSKTMPVKRPLAPEEVLPIPKNLQILPTDSEDERTRKKKRIHAIKSQNRLKALEDEGAEKKNAWQSFVSKPKKTLGAYTDKKKGSIFASPESVSGKVGVTGSGKPMTQPVVGMKDVKVVSSSKKGTSYLPSNEV